MSATLDAPAKVMVTATEFSERCFPRSDIAVKNALEFCNKGLFSMAGGALEWLYGLSDRTIALAGVGLAVLAILVSIGLYLYEQVRQDSRDRRGKVPVASFGSGGMVFDLGWRQGVISIVDKESRPWQLANIRVRSPRDLVLAFGYPDGDTNRGPNIRTAARLLVPEEPITSVIFREPWSRSALGCDIFYKAFTNPARDLSGEIIEFDVTITWHLDGRRQKLRTRTLVPKANGPFIT